MRKLGAHWASVVRNMVSDRHSRMKYLIMARSAEEGKQYIKEHESELKEFGKIGYSIVCIGGYFMADEMAEPEKIAFMLAVDDDCLKRCQFTDLCMSKTITEGCIKVEKVENGIVALESSSRNVERYG